MDLITMARRSRPWHGEAFLLICLCWIGLILVCDQQHFERYPKVYEWASCIDRHEWVWGSFCVAAAGLWIAGLAVVSRRRLLAPSLVGRFVGLFTAAFMFAVNGVFQLRADPFSFAAALMICCSGLALLIMLRFPDLPEFRRHG